MERGRRLKTLEFLDMLVLYSKDTKFHYPLIWRQGKISIKDWLDDWTKFVIVYLDSLWLYSSNNNYYKYCVYSTMSVHSSDWPDTDDQQSWMWMSEREWRPSLHSGTLLIRWLPRVRHGWTGEDGWWYAKTGKRGLETCWMCGWFRRTEWRGERCVVWKNILG